MERLIYSESKFNSGWSSAKLIKWFGTISDVLENQNEDIWFKTVPLSAIAVGNTTSKTEILSVATIKYLLSPKSWVSLTLPL